MMTNRAPHAVTGAFGYSGKYIALRLLDEGRDVLTLTGSPNRPNPFGDRVRAVPFHFDKPEQLTKSLEGVEVLYNTYWVRFNHQTFTHADAVRNTKTLFQASADAGVQRIVHVSITNPSKDSPLEYFSGKAELEEVLQQTGVSYAILRPTVLFGKEDILVNNIAWALRRLPLFGVFGDGSYKLQPIYVDDLAKLAVRQGQARDNVTNVTIDAIGPETFTYRELVATIARILGLRRRWVVSMPPRIGYAAGTVLGKLMGDVLITWEEILGLMDNLLYVDSPPAGTTKLTDWVAEHADSLGHHYASELARRRDRTLNYDNPIP